MIDQIVLFDTWKILIAVLGAAFVSQGIKVILNMVKDKKGITLIDLVVTGGMPSTHSALVSSLFAILLLETGISSVTVVAIVLFIIVITDSMGVRRTAGEEAKALNRIIKLEKLKIHELHYALGHRPIEVLMGIVVGFVFAILVFFVNIA